MLPITRASLLVAAGWVVTTACADVIRVPQDQPTIQAALNLAQDGDEVIIADGIYTGPQNRNLDFLGKRIYLHSENGPHTTIIDCQNSGRGFYFHTAETPQSIIEGITVRFGWARANTPGAPSNGGAIYCRGASPTLRSCIFTLSRADGDGAGIWCETATPALFQCTFTNNATPGRGGGLFLNAGSAVNLTGCTLNVNTAVDGGGIYVQGSAATLNNCTFDTNAANGPQGRGGGIYLVSGSVNLTDCTFNMNTAATGGGARLAATAVLSRCTFLGNRADSFGGGVYADGANVTWTTGALIANTVSAAGGGAGLAAFAADVHMRDVVISGNDTLMGSGGGVFGNPLSYLTLTGCSILGNRAGSLGGGAYVAAPEARVTSCRIVGNTSSGGGGIYVGSTTDDAQFANCLLAGNYSPGDGGAVECAGSASFINTTLRRNASASQAGAVYAAGGRGVQIANSILWEDSPSEIVGGPNVQVRYSDVAGGWTGSGNLNLDPIFEPQTSGVWTGASYAYGSRRILLEDSAANWSPGALVGLLVNPSTAQPRSLLIIGNTSTNIEAYADAQAIAASESWVGPGMTYVIFGHRVLSGSPCVDAADNHAVPLDADDLDGDSDTAERLPLDLHGEPRFADDPATADTGSGAPPMVDMGASELPGEAGCNGCDTNCDGSINGFDIQGFVDILNGGPGCSPCAADANQDGSVNGFDIQRFVECMSG